MNAIPDDDKDTVLFPLNKYWFTFGSGHHMGPGKKSLSRCYTTIEAVFHDEAREMIRLRRGLKWGGSYDSASLAGVDQFGLVHIPFDEVKPQEGPNL